MTPFFAHSGTPGDLRDWQPLSDHLRSVASLAADFARTIGLHEAASVAGILHDLGKYDPAFQRRLAGSSETVDHSTAGAKVLAEAAAEARRSGGISKADYLMAQMVGLSILGHHAGLPDTNSADASSAARRLERYTGTIDQQSAEDVRFSLSGLFPEPLSHALSLDQEDRAFDLSVIGRMVFSCLVDADFKDTERFYHELEGRQPDRSWPALGEVLASMTTRFDAYLERKPRDGDLNALRRAVLHHVRGCASMDPGVFTLTVPTGGGKTLASLGFALDHAARHGHQRILYAIPYTSIVDQTADIFRDVLGADLVLEHHSAIEVAEQGASQRSTHERMKLAMEDWGAPVVVTTNVQLFESLFAARVSRSRKVHNIANSIIILDEAQAIPRPLLRPCVRVLDALARLCGCTIVLCTATQPALAAPRFQGGFDLEGRELAPDPGRLSVVLRRATVEHVGEMDNDALVAAMKQHEQGLIIVNGRRHALELYEHAVSQGLEGVVHLTTRQCAAHRRKVLSSVREKLVAGAACRVVATSLIEAGVDVDFPRVWRAEAGLDSIVQAAGRCNREGRCAKEASLVSVFSPPDYPPPTDIRRLISDMQRAFQGRKVDMLSLEAMEAYFEEVYWRSGDGLDEKRILASFSLTSSGADFSYREVARNFRMIDTELSPVIVPYDETAEMAISTLSVNKVPSGLAARNLQNYIVQIPQRERISLLRNGHARFVNPELRGDQFVVLESGSHLYRDSVGLVWEDAEVFATDRSII